MLNLYYVDDERSLKKFIKSYVDFFNNKLCLKDSNIFCGQGAVENFFNIIDKEESKNFNSSIFLLDVRMPVPKKLERANVWGKYDREKSDVCGFALAKYLIKYKSINKNNIRLFSAYKDIIQDEFEIFFPDKDKDKNIFVNKYDLDSNFFNDWIKDE